MPPPDDPATALPPADPDGAATVAQDPPGNHGPEGVLLRAPDPASAPRPVGSTPSSPPVTYAGAARGETASSTQARPQAIRFAIPRRPANHTPAAAEGAKVVYKFPARAVLTRDVAVLPQVDRERAHCFLDVSEVPPTPEGNALLAKAIAERVLDTPWTRFRRTGAGRSRFLMFLPAGPGDQPAAAVAALVAAPLKLSLRDGAFATVRAIPTAPFGQVRVLGDGFLYPFFDPSKMGYYEDVARLLEQGLGGLPVVDFGFIPDPSGLGFLPRVEFYVDASAYEEPHAEVQRRVTSCSVVPVPEAPQRLHRLVDLKLIVPPRSLPSSAPLCTTCDALGHWASVCHRCSGCAQRFKTVAVLEKHRGSCARFKAKQPASRQAAKGPAPAAAAVALSSVTKSLAATSDTSTTVRQIGAFQVVFNKNKKQRTDGDPLLAATPPSLSLTVVGGSYAVLGEEGDTSMEIEEGKVSEADSQHRNDVPVNPATTADAEMPLIEGERSSEALETPQVLAELRMEPIIMVTPVGLDEHTSVVPDGAVSETLASSVTHEIRASRVEPLPKLNWADSADEDEDMAYRSCPEDTSTALSVGISVVDPGDSGAQLPALQPVHPKRTLGAARPVVTSDSRAAAAPYPKAKPPALVVALDGADRHA